MSEPEEDNWHAESDRFGIWLIMAMSLGALVATLLVAAVYMLASP